MPIRDDIFNVSDNTPKQPFTYQSPIDAPSKKTTYTPNLGNNEEASFTFEDIMNLPTGSSSAGTRGGLGTSVTEDELKRNQRYAEYSPLIDNEDVSGWKQSNWDQAANGTLKGLNLAGTTIAGSVGMLYGLGKWIMPGGTFNDLFNNEISRELDGWNKRIEDLLPNYYTNRQQDASWYSPDNWFTTNFLFDKLIKNAGFAVGAIYSGNAFAGVAGSAASGLGSLALRGANAAQKWNTLNKVLTTSSRLLSQGKNIEVAAALEKTLLKGKSVEQVAQFTDELARLAKTTNNIATISDKTRRAVQSLYGISGEAGFEAVGLQMDFKENLVKEFTRTNGREPNMEELKAIDDQSSAVGNAAFIFNSLLLGATQYIQLPNLIGSSYKSSRNTANALLQDTDNVIFDASKRQWAAAPKSRLSRAIGIYKATPFSLMESFEEMSQSAISFGVEDYYNKKYSGEGEDFLGSALDAYAEVLSSKEGGEAFLLGGLTGGLMSWKENIKERKQRGINTSALISSMNQNKSMSDFMKAAAESVVRGVQLNIDSENSVIQGDELQAKDLEMDAAINYLTPRMKYGRMDLVLNDINELRQLASTQEGLDKLKESGEANPNDTLQSFGARLTSFEETTKSLKEIYDSLQLRYSGIMENGKRKYDEKTIDLMAYSLMKVRDYDRRLGSLVPKVMEAGIDFAPFMQGQENKISDEEIKSMYVEGMQKIENLNVPSEIKDSIAISLEDSIELYKRRDKMIEEYESLKTSPETYAEAEVIENAPVVATDDAPKVSIATSAGDQDFQIGQEYAVSYVQKKGDRGSIFEFPTFTILGRNEDGTIQIRASNGSVKNVDPSKLKDFGFFNVKDVKNKPNGRFFLRHVNQPAYKKTKTGEIEGRIWYNFDNDTLFFIYKNKKGKVVNEPLDIKKAFNAQKGYKFAQFRMGKPLTSLDQTDIQQAKGLTTEQRRYYRFEILGKLIDETVDRLETTRRKIKDREDQLERKQKELEKLRDRIDLFGWKRIADTGTSAVSAVARTINELETEIAALNADQSDLEYSLDYYYSYVDEFDNTNIGGQELLDELKEEKEQIEKTIKSTAEMISIQSKLIDKAKSLLKGLIDLLSDIFTSRQNTPQYVTDSINRMSKNLDVFGEMPEVKNFLEEEETIGEIEFSKSKLQKEIAGRTNKIEELANELKELDKKYEAHSKLYNAFQEAAERYQEEQKVREGILKDEAFKKEFFGNIEKEVSAGPPTGNDPDDILQSKAHDPRLPLLNVRFRMTSHPAKPEDGPDTRSEQVKRFERFTNNYDDLSAEEKSALKVIPITVNNEESVGLKGFVESTIDENQGFDKDKLADTDVGIIQWVVVKVKGDEYFYVDEKGKEIGKVGEEVDKSKLIHDVLSSTSLTYSSGELAGKNRFVDKNSKATPEQYQAAAKEYRKQILERKEITAADPRDFSISIGVPEKNITKVDGVNKYEFNAPDQTLLTTEDLLTDEEVIKVSTGEEIVGAGYSRKLPAGRPYMKKGSTIEYLHNRNFSREEAESIFEVLKAFAEKSLVGKEWDSAMFKYLKGVLYITKPSDKPMSRNQITFDFESGEFVIGKNEVRIPFNLTGNNAAANKAKFIAYLTNVYNQVDQKNLKSNDSFQEFYVENGKLNSRLWKNYRTFLASSSYIDVEGNRSPRQDKPYLGTSVRVKSATVETDYVFKNKYMIIEETEALFAKEPVINKAPQKTTVQPKQQVQPAKKPAASNKFVLTLNGKSLFYTVDNNQINVIPTEGDYGFISQALIKAGRLDNLRQSNPELSDISDEDLLPVFMRSFVEGNIAQAKPVAAQVVAPSIMSEKFTTPGGLTIHYENIGTAEKPQVVVDENAGDYKKQFDKIKALGKIPEDKIRDFIIAGITAELEQGGQKSTPVAAPTQPIPPTSNTGFKVNNDPDEEVFQRAPKGFQVDQITEDKWKAFENWMKTNLPQIKFERVKHLISTTEGGAAFGRLKQDLISIYEGADSGTPYHEAFEAVWKFFVPANEKLALYEEFLKRKGSFTEFHTGNTIDYSKATFDQAKEEMAEEFARYMKNKTVPQKVSGVSKVLKFFVDLFRFIKEVFSKPALIDQMFKDINGGYFADQQIAQESYQDLTPEYSRIGNLSAELVNALNQDMTHTIFTKIFRENRSFFDLVDSDFKASEIYNEIKENFMAKMPISEEEFKQLKLKNQKFLRSYGITIDDSDSFEIERTERSQSDYARDAFRVDIHNSNFAIKLLYATLPKTKYEYGDKSKTKIGEKVSKTLKYNFNNKFNTFQLEDRSKLFMQTLQGMYEKSTFNEMIEALVEKAQIDPAFGTMAQRMKINVADGVVNFDKLTYDDWRLLINWYSTFSKQQPQGIILYSDEDGNLYSEASDLNTTDQELVNDWIENIKTRSKIFKLVKGEGYKVNESIVKGYQQMSGKDKWIDFLNDIGISIPKNFFETFTASDRTNIESAAATILAHFSKDLKNINSKTLGVKSSLVRISKVVNKYNNPSYSAVVYGSEKQAKQKFVQHNYLSVFSNIFNNVKTLNDLLELRPELNQMFRANSEILRLGGEYFYADGTRTSKKLNVGYFDGMVDNPVDKMTYNDRLVSELNMNLKGRYYVLVPADSATEWFTTLGNKFDFSAMRENNSVWNSIYAQFRRYFQDEANLIINKKQLDLSDEAAKKADKLRFFEDILSPKLKEKFYKEVKSKSFDFNTFYVQNEKEFKESVSSFITKEADLLRKDLTSYGEISRVENGYSFSRLDKDFANENLNKEEISESDMNALMKFFSVNYIVNNIEYHKLLFGDPANFKDEIKRIKSFLSPRGRSFDSPEFRTWANQNLNNGLKTNDLGYRVFDKFVRSSVVKDFKVLSHFVSDPKFKENYPKLYEAYNDGEIESTDASAWGNPMFTRDFKIRNGDWTKEDEEFYQYDMALMRHENSSMLIKAKKYSEELQLKDIELLNKYKTKEPVKPQEVFKPIVSGVNTSNNTVLHKYSIMPMYYSIVKDYPIGKKMLMKMMLEDVDYNIVASGAKVGTKGQFSLFNGDKFTNEKYNNVQKIDWEYLGKQVETQYHEKDQTRGSQLTKLATMNLSEEGVALTPQIDELIKRHDRALDKMTEFGYQQLLKKLGIEEKIDASNNAYYELPDKSKLLKFFEDVFVPMNPDDNILKLLQLKDGQFTLPFESTNSYQRIKNILLAQVDKQIITQKLNGGPKVQITSLPFNNDSMDFYYKKGQEWVKADGTQPADTKLVPVSNALSFYSNDGGKTKRMEILVPVWFRAQLKSSPKFKNMSDEELLKYINKNVPSILEGIGFRIPTQELSSVDAFVVKGFLHESAGNTIVVPAELVKKAGSDFDIDKLNTYLKNVYIDNSGELKIVPYFESREQAKDFLDKITDKEQFRRELAELELNDRVMSETELEDLADKMYSSSLENEYFDSIGELILLNENFERLLTPNTGGQELKDLRDELVGISKEEFESASSSLLSRNYMSKQRHYFIVGKRGVGIAAVAQTGNALAQRTNVFLDVAKAAELAKNSYANRFLGDGKILLPHNTDSEGRPTISKIRDKVGKFISNKISYYIDGFVDIAKDPFIVQLGIDMNTAGTFLFLERIGVPTKTVIHFMNQPIIRKAIQMATIDGKRVTSFNKDDIMFLESMFGGSVADNISGDLLKNIQDFYSKEGLEFTERLNKLTNAQKAEQVLILREFLKYSTMANHLFKFTQATTYDTARFTDMSLFNRKKFSTDEEMRNNIFSSPTKIIDNSHLSKIVDALNGSQSALSTILKFEENTLKDIIDKTKDFFVRREYISKDDVVAISNKVTASFMDYVFQTSAKFKTAGETQTPSGMIPVLITNGKAVQSLMSLKSNPATKDNLFVNQLTTRVNPEDGGKYILFKNKDNSTDTRNTYIASIEELLDSEDSTIRGQVKDILLAGMVQYGTYKKPYSFTDLIPTDNYSNFVRSALDNMNYVELDNFNENRAFWRNNWNDQTIVPKINKLVKKETLEGYDIYRLPVIDFQNPKLTKENLISLSETFNKKELSSPVVLVERLKPNFIGKDKKKIRKDMAAKGDFSYMERTLYQVVMIDGKPLSYLSEYKGNQDIKVIYKKINAWGDGQFLQEYYTGPQKSAIDNRTEKVDEVDDQTIYNNIASLITKVEAPKQDKDPFTC